ncbi:MAG TPA: SCO family protein [Pseudobdellovibrionaceae bacterium]|jgi:protein SCO1/2
MNFLFLFLFLGLPNFALSISKDQVPSKSIYQLEQSWTTQENKSLVLKDLSGLPAVVTMTFSSCPGACPLMISDMKFFDSQLNKKEREQIQYFTFSIDPVRDTAEVLQKYHKKMHLDKRWKLLTSDKDQVREMAAILGFSYKEVGGGDFTHSTSLYLLSAKGEILARKERNSDWKEFLDKFRGQLKAAPVEK